MDPNSKSFTPAHLKSKDQTNEGEEQDLTTEELEDLQKEFDGNEENNETLEAPSSKNQIISSEPSEAVKTPSKGEKGW